MYIVQVRYVEHESVGTKVQIQFLARQCPNLSAVEIWMWM